MNYGVPRYSPRGAVDMRKYDQRVGRTGRMEDLGVALTIFKLFINITFSPDCQSCDQPESSLPQECSNRGIKIE